MLQSALIAYSLGVFGAAYSHPGAFQQTLFIALLLGLAFAGSLFWGRTKIAPTPFNPPVISLVGLWALACAFGFLRHLLWADAALLAQLPIKFEGADMRASGLVVGLPKKTEYGLQYEFQINHSDLGFTGRVLLNDYRVEGDRQQADAGRAMALNEAGAVSPGQQRVMILRLDRPHGVANPGGFDREGSLLRRGINGTGYVRSTLEVRPAQGPSLQRARHGLLMRMQTYTDQSSFGGLIEALVLGERENISPQQSTLFSRTGTSHLFVISGLHIGLVAGVSYWLGSGLLARFPSLGLSLPRQKAAKLLAIGTAVGYSALAGFTLPTVRALVMLCAVLAGQLFNRRLPVALRLNLALAIVLTLDPLAVTSAGFWFSFVGVGALLLRIEFKRPTNDGGKSPELSLGWLQSQLSVFAGLFLPLVFWGFPVSLLAPAINLIVIPLLGFLLVPLCLIFACFVMLSQPVASYIFALLAKILMLLTRGLESVADSKIGAWAQMSTNVYPLALFAVLGALLGIALLLYPGFGRLRILAGPLLLPLVWPVQQASSSPLKVDVVDVGQGLAVIVRTRAHVLVYDTGAGREDGFSSGNAIIAPVLRRMGVSHLDMAIVSHGDTDHAGGLEGLLAVLPANMVVSSELNRENSSNCHDFRDWVWDGVLFRFIGRPNRTESRNNRSCVLKISVEGQGVLLPGDIEKVVEQELVTRHSKNLKSSLLIAPHHGSKTSSSYPFLKTVRPKHAVFSAGYNNRFDHPADEIEERYKQMGISAYTTAGSGMLSFELRKVGEIGFESGYQFSPAQEYRQAQKRYWRCLRSCR